MSVCVLVESSAFDSTYAYVHPRPPPPQPTPPPPPKSVNFQANSQT